MIAVSFDLRGTLAQDETSEQRAFVTLARRLAVERDLVPAEDARAAEAFAAVRTELEAGRVALEAAGRGALEALYPGRSEPGDGSAFRLLAAECAAADTVALPSARELLERLDELAVPVAILCNGWFALERARAAAIGFAGPVLVPPVGAWKPSARAFEMLPALFRLTPDRIWHVGRDPFADVAGARDAGLNAVWFDPDGASFPSELAPPAERIERVGDLLGIIAGPYTASALALRRLMISQY